MSERIVRRSDASAKPARAVRKAPYAVGEVARMRPQDGSDREYLTARTPDGMVIIVIRTTRGFADLWLPQIGTWTLRWDNLVEFEIEVTERSDAFKAKTTVTHDPITLPSISIMRHPRF